MTPWSERESRAEPRDIQGGVYVLGARQRPVARIGYKEPECTWVDGRVLCEDLQSLQRIWGLPLTQTGKMYGWQLLEVRQSQPT